MKVPILGQKYVIPAVIIMSVLSIAGVVVNGLLLPGWPYVGIIEMLLLVAVFALFAADWSGMQVRFGILLYVVTTGLMVLAINHPALLGEFSFGNALGPFSNNVGLLIGLPWFLTLMFSYPLVAQMNVNMYLGALIGAAVALVPTIFMLYNCAALDFFFWTDNFPPIRAYITLFITYFALNFTGATMGIKPANPVAKPLYVIWFGFHFVLFAIHLVQQGRL